MTSADGGARAGQADREFERVERVARAFEIGPAGHDLGVGLDPEDRQRLVECGRRRRAGSSIDAIGPSQTARTAETLPTAKKGGSLSSRRRSQLLAMTSGPIPAGSPSETASGHGGPLSDNRSPRRAGGRAGNAARARLTRSSLDLRRRSASKFGAPTAGGSSRPHRTRTLIRSAEPKGGVAWPTLRSSSICCSGGGRSRTRDLIVGDDFGADRCAAACGAAAAAHRLGGAGRAARPRASACAWVVPAGSAIDICIRLSTASRGSATRTWRVSTSATIEKPPGTGIGSLIAPTGICGDQRGELGGQLLGADPAEIAADRRGRRFGELAGISGERGAGADLLDDARGIGLDLGGGFRRRRQEDLGDAIFGRCRADALSRVDHRLDLVVADGDEGLDLAALQPLPGELAADLALQRALGRADRAQIGAERLRASALKLRGEALVICVDLALARS